MLKTIKYNSIHFAHKVGTKLLRKMQSVVGASTVGVRALVLNEAKQILLVKHTYQRGWYFPGGGVNKNESPKAAIIRELEEETGIIVKSNPQLIGVFFHVIKSINDYPILYKIDEYTIIPANSPEIAEVGWFSYNDLPQETTPSTRKRLNEFFAQITPSEFW